MIQLSTLYSQDVTLWVENVETGETFGLEDGTARVEISITNTIPIFSYSFTLSGFDNVLSVNNGSTSIEPNCLGWAFFGEDNVNILDNYFYGGGTIGDVNVIPAQDDPDNPGQFLSIIATYNETLDDAVDDSNLAPYYLNFDEVLPGMNNGGTSFYTFNEETQSVEEIQNVVWKERTWKIGFNETYDAIGEDCNGDVHGLAEWDDCSICAGGNTNNEYNYNVDCAGECFGVSIEDNFGGCCDPEIVMAQYFIDTDGDGLGETSYGDQDGCENMGGELLNGTCVAYACDQPEGFADNATDESIGCDEQDYDDCSVCGGNNFCDENMEGLYCPGNFIGDDIDCEGYCFGSTPEANWYPDCDSDGLADTYDYNYICGEGHTDIWNEYLDLVCSDLDGDGDTDGNLIAIDPLNHSFDLYPGCTSNQVDECGACDGDGYDCRGTCHPNSPLSQLHSNEEYCELDGYGWGVSIIIPVDNPSAESTNPSDIDIHILEGCRPYNGYDSDFEYSYLNGLDICGECYLGNLPQNQVDSDENFNPGSYDLNYSCSGCADINANNYDTDALFDDGSCNFQLYSGDVNRDGLVNELDLDGIAQFWNYYTDNEREGASIVWFPQFAQDDYWYSPSGSLSTSGCAMFADADGDALVTNGDVSAVLLNWGKEVSDQYYYPWGPDGNAPDCLSYNYDLYRDNYVDMYDFILENYGYNSGTEDVIEYLAELLGLDLDLDYIPDGITVHQNYPNPFNPKTTFPLELGGIENKDITLRIYDIKGGLVYKQTLNIQPGSYISSSPFRWNAEGVSSGIYFYSFGPLLSDNITFNKLMLIK